MSNNNGIPGCCGMNSETETTNAWALKSVDELIAVGAVSAGARSLVASVLLLACEKGRSIGLDEAIAALRGKAA